MNQANRSELPCTVTAEYTITMKQPTPTDQTIHLTAKVIEASERKAVVEGTLGTVNQVTACAEACLLLSNQATQRTTVGKQQAFLVPVIVVAGKL